MRFKPKYVKALDFVNVSTLAYCYGIQCFVNGRWVKAGDSNGVYMFDNKQDRDNKISELKEI